MVNSGKMLLSMLMLVLMISYVVTQLNGNALKDSKSSYEEVIQSTSQLATAKLMNISDINMTYDGDIRDAEDIPVDFTILGEYRDTLGRLLASNKTLMVDNISNINIPLVGYITYDYIIGVTYGEAYDKVISLDDAGLTYGDYLNMTPYEQYIATKDQRGQYLLPVGYTYYMGSSTENLPVDFPTELANKMWRFTLGNVIYISDNSAISSSEYLGEIKCKIYIDEPGNNQLIEIDPNSNKELEDSRIFNITSFIESSGFKTIENLKNYVVMTSINEYLASYSGAGFSSMADNTGTSISINLGTADNKEDVGSNVINGPGVFAIVDVYKSNGSTYTLFDRVASFGASELVRKS